MSPEIEARAAARVSVAVDVASRPSLWAAVRGRDDADAWLGAGAYDGDIEELWLMTKAHGTPERVGIIRARLNSLGKTAPAEPVATKPPDVPAWKPPGRKKG